MLSLWLYTALQVFAAVTLFFSMSILSAVGKMPGGALKVEKRQSFATTILVSLPSWALLLWVSYDLHFHWFTLVVIGMGVLFFLRTMILRLIPDYSITRGWILFVLAWTAVVLGGFHYLAGTFGNYTGV